MHARGPENPANPAPSPPAPDAAVARVVPALIRSILEEPLTRHLGETRLPSRHAVAELVELTRELVFPGFFGKRGLTEASLPGHVLQLTARITDLAREQAHSALRYARSLDRARHCENTPHDDDACQRRAAEVAARFAEGLPELRRLLALDVAAAFDGDPAAVHTDETIFCYPGIDAIFSHRVAHTFSAMGVPLLPRIIQEMAHSRTGIDIHPGAHIGESFFIDHGGGVVIGETTRIGHHVRVYQGVTLGAKSFQTDEAGRLVRSGAQRHPTIGDRVTIYAGAVILGGDTVIGSDCVIGGSVFITQSVPPGHIVRQKTPELVLRSTAPGESRAASRQDPGAGI